uniref:Cytochrome c domain-containing protein n=1 Tax=Panagrellus redivivus TaxID=6233 RepID=A0A7E4UVT0_PANRE
MFKTARTYETVMPPKGYFPAADFAKFDPNRTAETWGCHWDKKEMEFMEAISTFFKNDPSAIGKSSRAKRTASMDSLGPKPNSMEANTALQNDGIVHDLKERAYVCSTCHAINRPSKYATSNETTGRMRVLSQTERTPSMDTSGSNPNAKEDHTALQYEGFVHFFKELKQVGRTNAWVRALAINGSTLERPPRTNRNVSMDNVGSKCNSKEGNTALQYEGFVHDFEEDAYVYSTRRAIKHPLQLVPKRTEIITILPVC